MRARSRFWPVCRLSSCLDDATRAGEVYKWLRDRLGPWAADAVRPCQSGTHEGGDGAWRVSSRTPASS
jgi:hypothetical protein